MPCFDAMPKQPLKGSVINEPEFHYSLHNGGTVTSITPTTSPGYLTLLTKQRLNKQSKPLDVMPHSITFALVMLFEAHFVIFAPGPKMFLPHLALICHLKIKKRSGEQTTCWN